MEGDDDGRGTNEDGAQGAGAAAERGKGTQSGWLASQCNRPAVIVSSRVHPGDVI